mgnify:CR=1 FL=1
MLLAYIESTSPDIVCLQEGTSHLTTPYWSQVTPHAQVIIVEDSFIRKHYLVSDVTGKSVNSYGVMILSKFPIDNIQNMPFESSNMGRTFMYITVKINDELVCPQAATQLTPSSPLVLYI